MLEVDPFDADVECLRLLIVVDDAGLGRARAGVIARLGGHGIVARTVRQAMELLSPTDPWAGVILDLRLPDGSGLDVLKWLRNLDRDIPILMHTGHSDHDVIGAACELPALYVEKPPTIAQIEQFFDSVEARARTCRIRGDIPTNHDDLSASPAPLPPGAALPADLRPLLVDAAQALNVEAAADVWQAYRVGLLARAATGRRSPDGESVVAECARILGVSRQTLQRLALFPTLWTLEEVSTVLERSARMGMGTSLSVSHFLIIGRLPRVARWRWIERVLAKRLDLRALCRELESQDRLS